MFGNTETNRAPFKGSLLNGKKGSKMKSNQTKIRKRPLLFLICALLLSLSLSSCSTLYAPLMELQNGTQNGSTSPSGNSTPNNSSTNVTITNTGTSDVSLASAKGLRSAVSVYCTFEATVGGNSFWNPLPSIQTYYSSGSGVIYSIDESGSAFIITNHHVVYHSSSNTSNHISNKIYVYLYGMESQACAIPASYVGGSVNYDIAVLRVERNELLKSAYLSGSAAAITIGSSDDVVPGMTTIAIGNPSATDLSGISVTKGIVSVDSEYITMTADDNSGEISFRVIRTDTPVNAGNSGGGLFNDKGELIGIVNAKISSADIEGIAYAIPSSVARAIADNIIDYCYGKNCESVMRGLLGVKITTTGYSTEYDTEKGVLRRVEEISVYEVTAGGLGDGMLLKNDVVKSITIGDKTISVTRQHHLIDAMLDVRVGDTVSIVIVRNGTEKIVSTTITESCLVKY